MVTVRIRLLKLNPLPRRFVVSRALNIMQEVRFRRRRMWVTTNAVLLEFVGVLICLTVRPIFVIRVVRSRNYVIYRGEGESVAVVFTR